MSASLSAAGEIRAKKKRISMIPRCSSWNNGRDNVEPDPGVNAFLTAPQRSRLLRNQPSVEPSVRPTLRLFRSLLVTRPFARAVSRVSIRAGRVCRVPALTTPGGRAASLKMHPWRIFLRMEIRDEHETDKYAAGLIVGADLSF